MIVLSAFRCSLILNYKHNLFLSDPNTCSAIIVRDYGEIDKNLFGTFVYIGKGSHNQAIYYNPEQWKRKEWKKGVHGDFLYFIFGKWIIAVTLS